MILVLLCLWSSARADWDPQQEIEAFNTGVVSLAEGETEQAEAAFRLALKGEADCGRCAHGLGIALVRQQRLAEARIVLEQAAQRYPERVELRTALAGASFAAQDFDAALAWARQAVGLDPDSLDAQIALQQTLLRQGQTGEARQQLARAGRLPGPERACLDILIDAELARPPEPSALSYCGQAQHPGLASTVHARLGVVEDRPGVTAAASVGATGVQLVAQALALHQQGADAQALPLLDRALSAEPRRVDARILRAVCRTRLGQLDAALVDLRGLLDADTWVQVHRSGEMSGVLTHSDEEQLRQGVRDGSGLLVSLLVEAGQLDQADATWERARKELGASAGLSAAGVRLRRAQGRLPDAWAILEHSLGQWPQDDALTILAGELATLDPAGQPPALAERLASARDWRSAWFRALSASKQGRPAACVVEARLSLSTMDQGPVPPGADDPVTVARLLHSCAVNASDREAADQAALALPGAEQMHPVARVNHAILREEAGDHEGALALLEGLKLESEGPRRAAHNVEVYASGELGRWDRALSAAPQADADVALWLAARLLDQGEEGRARQAVQGRCGELEGAQRESCEGV